MRGKGLLPDAIYRIVLKNTPIPTADFILVRSHGGRREFLLGLRAEKPYRGKWFVPGGRIAKDETVGRAVRRHLKRELGVRDGKIRFVGCLDVWNPPNLMGIRWHSIWHLHEVLVPANVVIRPNHENALVKWFDSINPRWPAPVRWALAKTGFK